MTNFLQINSKKIKYPFLNEDNSIKYNGLINNFKFRCQGLNQTNNYNKLKSSLLPFNIQLSYVAIKIDKPIYSINRIRTQFIAKSNNNEVIWYKYEGPLLGGGQNYLYIYGKKIKLSDWLKKDFMARSNLLFMNLENSY